jgi:lipopolysaccharide transport system permease protein
MMLQQTEWNIEIKPKSSALDFNFKEVWHYKDLLMLLVKRDFVAFYKQTILGPVWFFIQPLLTTAMYLLTFNGIAGISTDGLPGILFYLSGIVCWGYFAEALTKTSDTFVTNANIFGKVYFPRLIIPLSIVLSSLVRLGIQLLLFCGFWFYYLLTDSRIQPNWWGMLLLPLLVLLMAILALGLGIIFSSLTTKYRDLRFLLTFGIQLLMFATTVVYPFSATENKAAWMKTIVLANPFTSIIETFRFAFLGKGAFNWWYLGYTALVAVIILIIGVFTFNKVEKSFMDTV